MGKRIQITLESLDWGQLLDGLRGREQAWRWTAEFLRSGEPPGEIDLFVPEDSHEPEEAEAIADHFLSIIESIEGQIGEQGGW